MNRMGLRRRVFDVLERDVPGDYLADVVHYGLILVVMVSVGVAILATVPSLGLRDGGWFTLTERCALGVFIVEYVARLWVAPEHPLRRFMPAWRARLNYAATPAAIIDLLAIAPILATEFSEVDLHALLVLRLLRFLKLARYSSGFNALFLALKRERYALLSCLFILSAGVLVAATAMYLTERTIQPDKFGSIPEAMWWAVTTLTTVGYGDVVPVTPLGRVIGAMTMVSGLAMLALPIAIIASSFSEVISKHNFVVTFSMLSRLPPFSDLEAPILGDLMRVLNSHTYDRGHHVVRRGEGGRHLYVVLEGDVEVEDEAGFRRLGPGSVFGAGIGSEDMADPHAVRALSKTKILAIEENELQMLFARHPAMSKRFGHMARRRAKVRTEA